MGGMLFGYEVGVINQVLEMDTFATHFGYRGLADPDFESEMKTSRTGDITMTFLLGCLGGALIVSYLADKIGRKFSILTGSVLFNVGAILQVIANTFGVLVVGRVVAGLGVGILSMVVPLFIAETAPSHLRGRMVTVQQLMITIGILIASIVNAIIIKTVEKTNVEWRLALGMQLVPGSALLLINFFMPYSPRWLMTRGREEEATATVARLRSLPADDSVVQTEIREIREGIELERQVGTGSLKELLMPGIFNRVIIAFMLQLGQQWTGINFIMYYATSLIERMGFSKEQATIPFTIANNAINFIGTFPGMYLVERMGRKKLLMGGALVMGVSQFIACLAIGLSENHGSAWSWVAIFSLYGFVLGFASTWGPIVWVYQSEIFPLRLRGKGTGIGTMSNWGWNAVIAKVGPIMVKNIDFYTYLVFGGACIGMFLFTLLFVKETMGKTLEQMDDLF
ncbi:general substrate transporter, partial [Gaertneriomyces semiglobifer]